MCLKCLEISESVRDAFSTEEQAGSVTVVGPEIHGLRDHENERNTAIKQLGIDHTEGSECAGREIIIATNL